MSEATPTQPVVTPTDAPPQAGAEGTDARTDGSDLDSLLKVYDDQTAAPAAAATPPATPPQPAAAPTSADVVEIRQFRDQIAREKFSRDMQNTVKDVRGDLPADIFDDKFVQAWIDARAADDPRLAKAWVERDANPSQFKRVVSALGKELSTKYGKLPDRNVTEDREAVTAAMRGASNRAPETPPASYAGKSDAEFREDVRKKYGFNPL